MTYFTSSNTDGFTSAELTVLNTALEILIAGVDTADANNRDYISSVADRINNAWVAGITSDELAGKVRR